MNRPAPQLIPMKQWMRRSSINFFERNPDAIGAPGFVPLCNRIVVDVLAAGFEVFSRDTFFVTCRARQILTQNLKGDVFQENEIFQAEAALNAHLEDMHEYFDTRIEQGERKLELGGFGPGDIQKLVAHYETKSVTNAVTQYLDILAKADHYVTMLHYLWLIGELSDSPDESMRVKLNTEREVRQHLFGITRASTIHYDNIRRICNGVVDRRRQERSAQAERDRKRTAEFKAKTELGKGKKRKDREAAQQEQLATVQNEMDGMVSAAT